MNKENIPVGKMCKVLEVSRNSYYNWTKNRRADQIAFSKKLLEEIKDIYIMSYSTYGSPRITIELNNRGLKVSKAFVARLMRIEGIKSILRRKYVVTTDSKHNYSISDNILNREFKVDELGKVWVSDITYIKVNNNWVYLTTIIDLADRKVIGWSVSEDMTAKNTVIAAWTHARINRSINDDGLLFHSDRGVQYASNKFRDILEYNQNITQSMSRKGNCWDNAVAESFFKTIKYEMINHYKFKSIDEVKIAIFDYIENWYNRSRLHSALGYKTPVQREYELKFNYKNVA